jgi:DNA-binding CsgD family transcriptional regulator
MAVTTIGGNLQRKLERLRRERRIIVSLAEQAGLDRRRQSEIYLCYDKAPEIVFKGLLVTWRGNLDQLIAYCPAPTSRVRGSSCRIAELRRVFSPVVEILESPETARQSADLLWLDDDENIGRAMPAWIYGLGCVPLAGEWNGEFRAPRPFCPELFEQMARQPQALRWLTRQLAFSPQARLASPAISTRVGQVLTCLKSGYSEKEAANELGISKHTLHVYVKRLYHHFEVHSRGELLSLFIASAPQREPSDLSA